MKNRFIMCNHWICVAFPFSSALHSLIALIFRIIFFLVASIVNSTLSLTIHTSKNSIELMCFAVASASAFVHKLLILLYICFKCWFAVSTAVHQFGQFHYHFNYSVNCVCRRSMCLRVSGKMTRKTERNTNGTKIILEAFSIEQKLNASGDRERSKWIECALLWARKCVRLSAHTHTERKQSSDQSPQITSFTDKLLRSDNIISLQLNLIKFSCLFPLVYTIMLNMQHEPHPLGSCSPSSSP